MNKATVAELFIPKQATVCTWQCEEGQVYEQNDTCLDSNMTMKAAAAASTTKCRYRQQVKFTLRYSSKAYLEADQYKATTEQNRTHEHGTNMWEYPPFHSNTFFKPIHLHPYQSNLPSPPTFSIEKNGH